MITLVWKAVRAGKFMRPEYWAGRLEYWANWFNWLNIRVSTEFPVQVEIADFFPPPEKGPGKQFSNGKFDRNFRFPVLILVTEN